jgi:hypothetical protein
MKAVKQQKNPKDPLFSDNDKIKNKRKMSPSTQKVNVKSTKFWSERYDDEGDDLEKYIH